MNDENKSVDNETLLSERLRKGRVIRIRIVLIIALIAVICAYYATVLLLDEKGVFVKFTTDNGNASKTFYPVKADDYDVMSDDEYVKLLESEGFVSYSNGLTGVSESLDDDDYEKQSAPVKLLIDMLIAARLGDSISYNDCFSADYINTEGRREDFPPQEIYAAVITSEFNQYQLYSGNVENVENTEDKTYFYRLQYKIHNNDGTFRNDMDSNGYSPQTIIITTKNIDGLPKIESVVNFSNVVTSTYETNVTAVIIANVVGVIIFAAAVTVTVILFRKVGRKKEKPSE